MESQNSVNVQLAFNKDAFSKRAEHVLVICRYEDKWLLTKHKKRGLEFPGGKVETGESVENAARREALEETGAVLGELSYIGEYEVSEAGTSFVKAIIYGEVERLEEREHYYETDGPRFVAGDILDARHGSEYSFIMQDRVVEETLRYLEKEKSEGDKLC